MLDCHDDTPVLTDDGGLVGIDDLVEVGRYAGAAGQIHPLELNAVVQGSGKNSQTYCLAGMQSNTGTLNRFSDRSLQKMHGLYMFGYSYLLHLQKPASPQ